MRFAGIDFPGRVFLAPLSGITDTAFRQRAVSYGAGLVMVPMISSEAVNRGVKVICRDEKPLAVQLFGSTPESISKAASIIVKVTGCDLINVNMGCPAKKIMDQSSGAEILHKPGTIRKIIRSLKTTVTVPISVKIRLGAGKANVMENARLIQESGADMLMLHPRTAEQGYSGKADWKILSEVKSMLKIPVIGSGDVRNGPDAEKFFRETACDAVLIGRASLGRPYVFEEINYYLRHGKAIDKKYSPSYEFKEYLRLALDIGEVGLAEIRQQAIYFTKGIVGGASIRILLARMKHLDDIAGLMEKLTDA